MSRKIIILFLVVNILLIINLVVHSNPERPVINLQEIKGYFKEYNFSSVVNNGFISNTHIEYPHVQIGLNDLRYYYILFKEARDLKNGKYEHTFYAGKRLSELMKWGSTTPMIQSPAVVKSITNKASPGEILTVIRSTTPNALMEFNSWESSLLRYADLIESRNNILTEKIRINRQGNIEDIIVLYSLLKTHQTDLQLTIDTLEIPDKDRKYLLALSRSVFSYLINEVNKNLPSFSPTNIYFPLSDITNEREYGIYDASVYNFGTKLDAFKTSTLKIGDRNYSAVKQLDTDNELLYENIEILDSSHLLASFNDSSFIIKTNNLSSDLQWSKERRLYIYRSDFSDEQANNQYYIKIHSDLKTPVTVTLTHLNSNGGVKANIIIPKKLIDRRIDIKSGGTSTIEEIVKLDGQVQSSPRFRVRLESPVPLSPDDLKNITVETTRFNSPLITLRKSPGSALRNTGIDYERLNQISYKIQMDNSSLTEDNYTKQILSRDWQIVEDKVTHKTNIDSASVFIVRYKPFIESFILFLLINSLFGLSLAWSFLKSFLKYSGRSRLVNYFSTVSKQVHYFSIKYRFYLLFLFVLEFLYDIFFLQSYSDVIITGVIAIWILLLIGFSLNSSYSFITALILLVLAPLLLLYGNTIVGEKMVIWAFSLILIACTQLIIELYGKSYTDWHILILKLSKQLEQRIESIENMFVRIINILKITVHRIFKIPPTSLRDHISNIFFSVILLVVLLCVIFTAFKLYGIAEIQINRLNRDKIRLSRHPRINSVEPKIVYYSNKIIITGNQFGWKEKETVFLNSDTGAIYTDLWTDDKIIFTVPLHWSTGKKQLWIERKTEWDNKPYTARSNVATIEIIPRSDVFTESDDRYFEQLNSLGAEALQLNGYR